MMFPTLHVSDLNGKKLTIPADFETPYTLCVIAFERNQQKDVDTWADGTKSIIEPAGVSFYEIPTISRVPWFVRNFINSGMNRGIPSATARAHTISLYINKTPFRQSLGLGTEKTIYAKLVNRSGAVLWSGSGDFTVQQGDSLRQTITGLTKIPE
jgi:hypothetical protein